MSSGHDTMPGARPAVGGPLGPQYGVLGNPQGRAADGNTGLSNAAGLASLSKRPSEAGAASSKKRKKPAERVLPKQIEAYIPESKLYTQMQEFERKLDTTISRKKLDMMEQKSQMKPTKRVLRVFLSNLASDQFADVTEEEDLFSLETMRAPSWTLRIEGRLLDLPASRKPQVNPPKFSSFVRSVVVELERDGNLYPEDNVIEWHRMDGTPECDGFEIKRKGDSNVNAKIMIYLENKPEKFKLSPPLAKLLDIHTDTAANVIIALWQYVKFQKLQEPDDKRQINCDEQLRNILGMSRVSFSQIPELLRAHFSPPDPVILNYTITTDKEHHVHQFAYDIDVEVASPADGGDVVAPNITKDIGALDEKITSLIQSINHCKLKRDFMLAFADNPVDFLDRWVASQSRDLETVLGDSHFNMEEIRRSDFYDKEIVHQAVFHHLRQKDAI
ncbi:SWI/SNF-related matrix-associated actin-dependent regulator of chromatin subfamily D member 1 [Fimicolochytrium jonesii]|uniref:SWI/SNF-related matrix-associated actin-dependent regulator of chromatin subfamily D member 1 n=1 Tax=Fimicolochytrium jonesii TaxID=1396493 RepID=UPI0022FE6A56|nr:SWI/SNF-related matrix-associated actin-dependent regulator of chromatin subfamily D member 1 [Fimicolochytrium jonesii]KAI8822160.1 SWI/SNF-related matrix-associated actin-dependent regulator of chromatin subfamily D member 1 [Fimicolochytrium jonesii]